MKNVCSLILLTVVALLQEQSPAAAPHHLFFDSGGTRISYVEQGEGPAVLLIHGYIGHAERHWINTGVFTNLAKDHRVIALDCRGHGKSDKPTEPAAYGPEMGRDVIRLLDHLNIQRAHIVGFSMGAMIAGHLLTTDADRFLSVTFVGYHPVRVWTAADEHDAEISTRNLDTDDPFRSLILSIWPKDSPLPTEDEIRKSSQALLADNDPKALAAYNRGRHKLVVPDARIAAVQVPALGIIGSADPSLRSLQDVKKVMQALSIAIVDGAEHGGEHGVLRRPEFLAALRQFLAANADRHSRRQR